MKKSLIALAVFGMFTGAAMADGNSVTLYGKIDAGLTHFTGLNNGNGGTTSSTGLSSGVTGGDRIGFKGTEDLGGGLKVLFDAETGFCGTGFNQMNTTNGAKQSFCTGSGYFMGRQAYLGMTGDFGTVLAGRLYDAIFSAEANLDPFGAGLTGQSANLDVVVGQIGLIRSNQAIAYVTPNLSGFTGTAAYVMAAGNGTVAQPSVTVANTGPTATVVGYTASGEKIYGTTTTTAAYGNVPRAFDLKGEYANGPIYGVVDYAQVQNAVSNGAGALNDGKIKVWLAGGSYDFGVAKVVAEYQTAKYDYTTGKTDFWMLGATVPVGAGSILASYGNAKSTLGGLTNATAKQYAIGYTYNLSKQTSLYTSYAHLTNDQNTHFTVGDATDAFGAGINNQASSGFALGMVHNF
jgi:predicted porin